MVCIPGRTYLIPRPEHDPSQVKSSQYKVRLLSSVPLFMRQASAKYNSEEYLGGKRRSQTGARTTLVNTIQELYSTWVKLQR